MMTPKRKKHCRSLHPDVLSNLPDNIIDVILMHLPCKDAVLTSMLSRKWRFNWCRRTELMLDESHWRTKNDLLDPTIKFKKIIYQFLSLHEGPITKFTLDIEELERCPNIDNFISFLSRNDIQHLVLHLPWRTPYKLPSSLFTCSQLRHLTLYDCLIHPPSDFKGFDRLISLKLSAVTISFELLGSLISHCLLLEQLVLEQLMLETSSVLNIFEINALNLRSFDFIGTISSICLKNVPLLAKVSLEGRGAPGEVDNFGFAKFFESCSALEHLLLNYFYSERALDEPGEVATRLPFDVNCVKRFSLPEIVLRESHKLARALCLIRSFPSLEYLEIKLFNDVEAAYGPVKFLELERFSDVTFNHLMDVKLEGFAGTTSEMQLIKLLLAKSPVLVRMLIDRWILDDGPLDTRLKIFAEVSKFVCASPKAEIVFIKSHHYM